MRKDAVVGIILTVAIMSLVFYTTCKFRDRYCEPSHFQTIEQKQQIVLRGIR